MIIYWTTQNLVSFKLSLEKKLKLTFGALHLKETDSPFWQLFGPGFPVSPASGWQSQFRARLYL